MSSSTILAEIEMYMKRNNLKNRHLALKIGVDPATVTYLFNGGRILTVANLDRITELMGHPRGYFYEQYIEDYLQDRTPDWRRIGPFLNHCAEIGKVDCIRAVVGLLMENPVHTGLLFDMAEDLFKAGNYAVAEILYHNIALSEHRQYSERLALCQYRLFKIKIGTNQVDNYKIASQFEPYVDRLDEWEQLDALKDLANVYRSLRRFEQLELFAKEMERKARIIYFSKKRAKTNPTQLSRPLFVYIAYGKLLLAEVCEGLSDYEGALRYTYEYADLSWVQEQDEETRHWLDLFKKWSIANMYTNKLMNGDCSILDEYLKYLKQQPDEIMSGLFNIIFAANRYKLNVDHVLLDFKLQIEAYSHQGTQDLYEGQVLANNYNSFLYELTCYYLNKMDYTNGLGTLIHGLENSILIRRESSIVKFMAWFEKVRSVANAEIETRYKNIIREVLEQV